MYPVEFTTDPVHHGTPILLQEQADEWTMRLFRDLFYTIQRHLHRLGSLPLPHQVDCEARGGGLRMTVIVKFEREAR